MDKNPSRNIKKILVIRFHAFGDTIITLPYINGIRSKYPKAKIDLLTTERVAIIPRNIHLFDGVIGVAGGMNAKQIAFHTLLTIPKLWRKKYDQIVDLQNDRKSNLIFSILGFKNRNLFNKYGKIFCGLRYQNAIESALGQQIEPNFAIQHQDLTLGNKKLDAKGFRVGEKLIVLNPAGFYKNRNWPIENYLQLIQIIKLQFQNPFKILLLGDQRIYEKSQQMEKAFPELVINLVNQTTQLEAYSILKKVDVIISEDSGLAHMAWTQGVKTLLMLGSSPSYWISVPHEHVINLNSSDLACGDCFSDTCLHGDVRCLTRYSPDYVFGLVQPWLNAV
ncbi:MAG: glycosyltransferase family 9 protein [Saprospiraceae bacterium]